MYKELERINTIGDARGILYFANIALTKSEIKRDIARQRCSLTNEGQIHFDAAVQFFDDIGLVTLPSKNIIRATELGLKLYSAQNATNFIFEVCKLCVIKRIADGQLNPTKIIFDLTKTKYALLNTAFNLTAAVFRNFLITFKALTPYDGGAKLQIASQLEAFFVTEQKKVKKILTLFELNNKLEQQERQGEEAELFALTYECKRLGVTEATDKIKRISDADVTAGYDIVSRETIESAEFDRLIEVKSFIGDLHFYWSSNEIKTAKLFGEQYYLYLIDADCLNQENYLPTIIRNPARLIFESAEWCKTPQSYFVFPTTYITLPLNSH
ncbi:MAG: DUF3883 domain-containing protein [Christensenellaceae bacterium]|jgi:hypothetical protein|nr:DUF3883 domain-containing protein [Christensenellaceae bacterium]